MQGRRVSRSEYPMWVQLSLWGLPNRASVWLFVWLSLVAGIACGVYGFLRNPWFLIGVPMVVAAVPYWLAIKWVDRHGAW